MKRTLPQGGGATQTNCRLHTDNSIQSIHGIGQHTTTTCWKNRTPHRKLSTTGERNDKAENGRRKENHLCHMMLFTKTPIKEACEVIRKRLESDKTLKKRTNLTIDDIMELLKFVLETTYFRFGGEIYQKFGVVMGSPVSPIVVNLCMEDLEQKIIATAPADCQPRNWKRYVDEIICLVHTGKAKTLQQHMNTVDPTGSIIFTREDEENNSVPLLDAKVTRKEDGSVKSTVFRKRMHTLRPTTPNIRS